MLKAKGRSQEVKLFVAKITTEDLEFLGGLLESGQVKAVVEKTYPLSEAADALAHLGEGHATAKIALTV
jgi:NADPH:quinone reductase-like Zn-dependent oxidoreductase